MECIRGFSNTFMPENKIETVDLPLQYIEGGDLEKAWKQTRRQRLKEQEQKIWEEFTREKDILSAVLNDDPYQFIEDLPEVHVQELIAQTRKAKNPQLDEPFQEEAYKDQDHTDDRKSLSPDRFQGVTFTSLREDESGIFHIYSDDKDSDQEDKDEEDNMNESTESPPHTVRERSPEKKEHETDAQDNTQDVDNKTNKSSENIANIIESSIYCARVKELRKRIVNEINDIIGTLDNQAIIQLEPAEIRRMTKRSAEFCGRFQRIHLYQLHRQMYDIKRHNASATPFAKHTQFQSQMVRVVSLHQNMLQSFQVFHKCQSGSLCLRDSTAQVRALGAASQDATRLCREAVPAPSCPAQALYDDKLEETCQNLDEALKLYEERLVNYIGPIESSRSSTRRSVRSKTSENKNKGVKKRAGPWVKPSKSSADSRLSMYSLDTLRLNLASCPSSKEPPSSSTSRVRNVASPVQKLNVDLKSAVSASKPTKKSPTSRRPLMRDPQQGKPPRRSRVKDSEITTMVEVVEAPSSHMSIDNSPRAELTNLYHSMKAPSAKQSPRPRAPRIPPNSVVTDSDRRSKKELSPKEKYCIADVPDDQTFRGGEYCLPKLEDIENDAPVEDQLSPKRRTKKENVSPKKNESPKNVNPQTGCEVTRLLRQLCGNSGGYKNERMTGAKNAQLVNINGSSPRQPSTPQLLRILEETIQKKAPRPMYQIPRFQDVDRYRLTFNIPDKTCDQLLKYRTKFVQYMLSSSMYANGAVGKPWEVIDSISSEIIDEILEQLASEMEMSNVLKQMLKCETAAV